jgi:hypothetical protein
MNNGKSGNEDTGGRRGSAYVKYVKLPYLEYEVTK